ncbi:Uncharacterized protein FWK35_00010597 [Aphis craccivora]|uniref:Uncharacterized protein n=1 Tax=Aphis craccivora TaxID=307492 RepID=A0A6G0YQW7_APHCR|nr:Uncharacterized protein FWK35_00010597 [Aphis craccivora]
MLHTGTTTRSTSTSGCDCGYEKQTAIHITDDCNTRRLHGGMQELHRATIDTVKLLNSLDI